MSIGIKRDFKNKKGSFGLELLNHLIKIKFLDLI